MGVFCMSVKNYEKQRKDVKSLPVSAKSLFARLRCRSNRRENVTFSATMRSQERGVFRQSALAMTSSRTAGSTESGPSSFGAFVPGSFDRAVIALTSRLPDNWLGLRLAIGFRRLVTMRLAYPDGALDVIRWGVRLRLHPRDNGCEKNLLFTPQMYEPTERAELAAEIDRAKPDDTPFVFVDIGANVGLFSFFVAARAGRNARILAVEPDPENLSRLLFNMLINPGVPI